MGTQVAVTISGATRGCAAQYATISGTMSSARSSESRSASTRPQIA